MRVLRVGLWLRVVLMGVVLVVVAAAMSAPANAKTRVTNRTVSLTASASTVTAGQTVIFSGMVSASPKGSTVIIDRAFGRRWIPVAATSTRSADGTFSVRMKTSGAGQQVYRAWVPGTRGLGSAVSSPVQLTVNRSVAVSLMATPSSLTLGDPVTFTGKATPFVAGAAVQLQQLSADTWSTIATSTLSAKGMFTFSLTPTATGTGSYRVLVDGSTAKYLAAGTSKTRTVVVAPVPTWASVSAGTSYTCATKTDTTLWCWGLNSSGQLGLGDTTDRSVPTKLAGTGWTSVATGATHACATKADGSLWCWGLNSSGQLGIASLVDASSPTRVGTGSDWKSVAAGYAHTCAIRTTGTLWCWGSDDGAKLGLGSDDLSDRTSPVQVGTRSDWKSVTAGRLHTCAMTTGTTTTGVLWCWGFNEYYGALGVEDGSGPLGFPLEEYTPTEVSLVTIPNPPADGTQWASITAGDFHTCATTTTGGLWCWGWNGSGQIGLGQRLADVSQWPMPTYLYVINAAQVAAGHAHTCATLTNGKLECWGDNSSGQVGTIYGAAPGAAAGSPVYYPTWVDSTTTWASVTAGYAHTCAIRTDGTLWCWGAGESGELGLGTTTNQPVPVKVG